MSNIRFPEVAGAFYPAHPETALTALREAFANTFDPEIRSPKILVLPHAGWDYCLPVMTQGLRAIHPHRSRIKKVVLLGPAHRVAFKGVATTSVAGWKTPFGDTAIDVQTLNSLISKKKIHVADHAFSREHSLEVILPALQQTLRDFTLIPLLVGDATAADLDVVIESLWGGAETLIVVSSDLSHFLKGKDAYEVDTSTRIATETFMMKNITAKEACGHRALNAVLRACEKRDYRMTALDVRHSGMMTGNHDRVVGYGAFVGEPSLAARLPDHDRKHLIKTAIDALALASKTGSMPSFNVNGHLKPHFAAMRATFVTLKLDGKLRGCIGSLIPHRSLIMDVATNAVKAGFQDPRFKPITVEELERLEVEISILSHPAPMTFKSEADLIAQMRPDVDGLILKDGKNSGLFLPSVWESLPRSEDFLKGLKRKAGLPENHWSENLSIKRFTAEKWGNEYIEELRKAA